jgi:hypothetical protein
MGEGRLMASLPIPILSGIYTDAGNDYRVSYPVNLQPVAADTGIGDSYLRPCDGITALTTGPGDDRGGIQWKGDHYRVMGEYLCHITSFGMVSMVGNVGPGTRCTFDYSFDRLGITAGGNLYYWDKTTFTQVSDPDVGNVLDHIWIDGYFLFTDGEFLIVTELNDPESINPLKYGSSEVDPDPVKAVLKVRNEPYAVNRYTIEVYENTGGSGFPFQRISGGQITKGAIGTHAACVWNEAIAFVGGGRNEAVSVYLGANAQATKIATAEVDRVINGYTESQLSDVIVEARVDRDANLLLVHLPHETLCYDSIASQALQRPIWHVLTSGDHYRARNLVRCHDRWYVGDTLTARVGYLDEATGLHWGDVVPWEFGTAVLYNGGPSAIIHRLELMGLTGRAPLGADPLVSTSYSHDGLTWSQDKTTAAGKQGERNARLCWLRQGLVRRWRVQRFRGTSDARVTVSRLDAEVESLNV